MNATITKISDKEYVGYLPAALALSSNDIGRGFDDEGKEVFFAWGPCWAIDEIPSHIGDVAQVGQMWERGRLRDYYAPIISRRHAEKLLSILDPIEKK